MITLQPASIRPIRLYPASQRGIVIETVDAALPAPAIQLLTRPPGPQGPTGQTGATGQNGADLNGYDPGDLTLTFENGLI
jgi:hypothetical protein